MAEPFEGGGSLVGGDDLLGAPSASDAGVPVRSGPGWLAELDTGLYVREWLAASSITMDLVSVFMSDTSATLAGNPGVYAASLGSRVRCVDALHENGVALTSVGSIAAVDSTAGTWYFDGIAGALWVHTSDDSAATTKILIASVVLLFKHGAGRGVFLRGGVPHHYAARLVSVPGVSLEIPADDVGQGATATFGDLVLSDLDGIFGGDLVRGYRGLLAERLFAGRAARLYRGDMLLESREEFTLWASAKMETPSVDGGQCTIPLVSAARTLETPLCSEEFSVDDYQDMDPDIEGLPIPRVYGPVSRAEAFLIDDVAGRWKVSANSLSVLTDCTLEDGTTVAITLSDGPNGEFEVSTAHNGERRLYVNVGATETPNGLPGELLAQIAEDAGHPVAEIDFAAMARLDVDRPVVIGIQFLGGSGREALVRVAEQAFVDWYFTRDGLLAARARRRDQGNLILNPGAEVDASGMDGREGAAVTRTTTYKARGAGAFRIAKDAGNGLGHGRVLPRLVVDAGKRYALTCLVALEPGSPGSTQARIALADGAGNEDLSDPVALTPGVYQRLFLLTEGVLQTAVTMDREDIGMDSSSITMDMGAVEMRIYPEHGGSGAVVLIVDDLEWVEVETVGANVADIGSLGEHTLKLWKVRVPYARDLVTGDSQYSVTKTPARRYLYPSAESRVVPADGGDLQAQAGGAAVGAAVFDYFSVTRGDLSVTLKRWTERPLTQDTVIHLTHPRAPGIVNHSGLWRVLRLQESQTDKGALPTVTLGVTAHYDPAMDRQTV